MRHQSCLAIEAGAGRRASFSQSQRSSSSSLSTRRSLAPSHRAQSLHLLSATFSARKTDCPRFSSIERDTHTVSQSHLRDTLRFDESGVSMRTPVDSRKPTGGAASSHACAAPPEGARTRRADSSWTRFCCLSLSLYLSLLCRSTLFYFPDSRSLDEVRLLLTCANTSST